jgi:hypothetical protein
VQALLLECCILLHGSVSTDSIAQPGCAVLTDLCVQVGSDVGARVFFAGGSFVIVRYSAGLLQLQHHWLVHSSGGVQYKSGSGCPTRILSDSLG